LLLRDLAGDNYRIAQLSMTRLNELLCPSAASSGGPSTPSTIATTTGVLRAYLSKQLGRGVADTEFAAFWKRTDEKEAEAFFAKKALTSVEEGLARLEQDTTYPSFGQRIQTQFLAFNPSKTPSNTTSNGGFALALPKMVAAFINKHSNGVVVTEAYVEPLVAQYATELQSIFAQPRFQHAVGAMLATEAAEYLGQLDKDAFSNFLPRFAASIRAHASAFPPPSHAVVNTDATVATDVAPTLTSPARHTATSPTSTTDGESSELDDDGCTIS
jgi:hypothetical protein